MDTTGIIHEEALRIGFNAAAWIAVPDLREDSEHFRRWINAGNSAGMEYLERSATYRHDLTRIFPAVRSVVVTLASYNREYLGLAVNPRAKIARYAWGEDYHVVLKEKLNELLGRLRDYPQLSAVKGRAVVDSAPAFERAIAIRAGLGWKGRNSLLLHPRLGSYSMIGLLLLDHPVPDDVAPPAILPFGCGECHRCVTACPGEAIQPDFTIDARRCASYLNKECKRPLEASQKAITKGRIFGCDACLEACPYNYTAPAVEAGKNTLLPIREDLPGITPEQWEEMTQEAFTSRFSRTALHFTGLEKIKSNLRE